MVKKFKRLSHNTAYRVYDDSGRMTCEGQPLVKGVWFGEVR